MNLVKTCRNVPSTSAKNIPMFPIENQQISRKKKFALHKYLSHQSKYKISFRGPSLCNKVLSSTNESPRNLFI